MTATTPACWCNGEGGRPWNWTDRDGRVHHDWQFCSCPAATERLGRASRFPDNADRTETWGRR